MLMKIETDSDLSYEDLFEQATEDISTYLWAIQEWLDPEDGYAQDYLLMLILSNRKRSRVATERMTQDVPSEYQPYRTKLVSLKDRAEDLLTEELLLHNKRIETIVSDEFLQRVKVLESDLLKLRHITHDGILFDNTEWVEDDLREYAKRFLMNFHDMALANGELEEKPFQSVIKAEEFREKFAGTEQLFRKYFGYFHVVQDLFPSLRDREYDPDLWWLNHIPGPDDVEEDEVSEAFMDGLSRAFQAEKRSATEDCPRADNVIAYAFNELDPELNRDTREHLLTCGGCFDLFMDLRAAEADAGDEVSEVMPGVLEAMEAMKATSITDEEKQDLETMLLLAGSHRANIMQAAFLQYSLFGSVFISIVKQQEKKKRGRSRMSAPTETSQPEPLEIPASFRLSEQSLTNLRKEEIPGQIIAELETLKDQIYPDKDKFMAVLNAAIGEDESIQYKPLILKHAEISGNFFEMEIESDDGWLELLSPDMDADENLLKICEFLEDKTYHWGLLTCEEDGWQALGKVESETSMPLGTDDSEKDILLLCIGLGKDAVSDALGKAVSALNAPTDIGAISEEPETSLPFVWVYYRIIQSGD